MFEWPTTRPEAVNECIALLASSEHPSGDLRQDVEGRHFALLYSSSVTGFNQIVFPFWVGVTAM